MTAIATVRFEIVDVTEDADLRRQLADALAAVEEWRAAANDRVIERDGVGEELATARAENVRLHNRVNALCDTDRNAARLVAMIAERDRAIAERDAARTERRACEAECELLRKENCGLRDDVEGAIAERDEARKALEDEKARGPVIGIAGCNLKAGSHVAWMDSTELAALRRERDAAQSQWRALQSEIEGRDADRAELAALRARVAELEGEEERRRRVAFIAAGGKRFTIFEYAEFAQGRIRELEAKIEARDNRVRVLRERLDAIAGISTRD